MDAFSSFQSAVLEDASLQEALQRPETWDAFVPVALAAAGELGLPLRQEDLEEARDGARRAWFERWI